MNEKRKGGIEQYDTYSGTNERNAKDQYHLEPIIHVCIVFCHTAVADPI